MHVVQARNVNEAYPRGAALLRVHGVQAPSRYGEVLVADRPVTTMYNQPWECVLFDEVRDANPFLHFFEALWMLAGRNDIGFVTQFSKKIADFSDDGITQHAAYGYRWRRQYHLDQLIQVITMLRQDRTTRRAYLQMWDCRLDLNRPGRDFPCNVGVAFGAVEGRLNMTVFNRSNDMIWGAYGANAVHMAFLQKYIADKADLQMGWYAQVSNNFHAYKAMWLEKRLDQGTIDSACLYQTGAVCPYPTLVTRVGMFDTELSDFLSTPHHVSSNRYTNEFFSDVAQPLFRGHDLWRRTGNKDAAVTILKECIATDWRHAAITWINRRKERRSHV